MFKNVYEAMYIIEIIYTTLVSNCGGCQISGFIMLLYKEVHSACFTTHLPTHISKQFGYRMKFKIALFIISGFLYCNINIVDAVKIKDIAFELEENLYDGLDIDNMDSDRHSIENESEERERIIKLISEKHHAYLFQSIKRSNVDCNETLTDFMYLTILIIVAQLFGAIT